MSIQENPQDLQALETAVKLLTDTPVMIKISNVVGSTIEAGLKALPQKGRDVIQQATQKGLNKAVELAGKTLEAKVQEASTKTHMFAAAASGAIGGFFGFGGRNPCHDCADDALHPRHRPQRGTRHHGSESTAGMPQRL
jgi:hypothetical protein